MKRILQTLAVAAAAIGLSATAHAVPTLYLSTDGVLWTTVATDQGVGDSSPGVGQVTFIGSFGNFSLNVHTGTTYPVIGSLTNPALDLSYNATSSAPGTLYVAFSANGFGPSNGTPDASIGGTAKQGGSVEYFTYGGSSNTLLDLSVLLTDSGVLSGTSYASDHTGSAVNSAGPYSLTQVIKITATAGSQNITGDAGLSVPDSGTTVMLLGAGLTVLALFSRARKQLV